MNGEGKNNQSIKLYKQESRPSILGAKKHTGKRRKHRGQVLCGGCPSVEGADEGADDFGSEV